MKLKCFESTDSNGTEQYLIPLQDGSFVAVPKEQIEHIVRCKECRWAKANGTYQWCGRLDSTARITADDFCSYGERSSE